MSGKWQNKEKARSHQSDVVKVFVCAGKNNGCHGCDQGCQMVGFQTKNPNLGKFFSALEWKIFIIVWPLGIFYGHLGYFMTIWYILCSCGTFFPVLVSRTKKNLATLVAMSSDQRDTKTIFENVTTAGRRPTKRRAIKRCATKRRF
jgi:hypothetical protein